MADRSTIEWTDATWNPVRGCSRISAGCGGPNHRGGCYAETIAARFSGPGQPFEGFAERTPHGGRWTGRMALVDELLTQPLRWKRPRRIFVNSMSDLFHENLPDEAIDKVFAVMALAPQHTFQVLTKRPKRMREWFMERWQGTPAQDITFADGTVLHCPRGGETGRRHQVEAALLKLADDRNMIDPDIDEQWDEKGRLKIGRFSWPLPNVWLGVSTEDQPTADEHIPDLLATPAAKRFISAEPLLGPLNLRPWLFDWGCSCGYGGHQTLDHCPSCGWVGDGPTVEVVGGDAPGDCPECSEPLSDYYACPECKGTGNDESNFGPNSEWIDWVIAGGESGRTARPMHPDWARSLRDQCAAANVPFFFKQWGEWGPVDPSRKAECHAIGNDGTHYLMSDLAWPDGARRGEAIRADFDKTHACTTYRVGKKAAGAELDGKMHREFPT